MSYIYLASPYSHDDPEIRKARFIQICEIAGDLMKEGYKILSPIAQTHEIAIRCDLPTDIEYWRSWNYALLRHADKLLIAKMAGWDISKGIAWEIKIAKSLDIEIEYLEI
jgi:hypothetical protein